MCVVTFADLARFSLDFAARTITAFEVSEATAESGLEHLLYDHVAPRIIASQDRTNQPAIVLHAASIAMGGGLAVLLGDTGAGKSTLSASLHLAGHRLLGDDAVIVTRADAQFLGEPVYPSLRLDPETAEALFGADIATTPMAHYSDKVWVMLDALSTANAGPLPISALFFLAGDTDASEPRANRLSPAQACIKLIEQSFALDPHDAAQAARRFDQASRLAQAVPAYALSYPHYLSELGRVHTLIRACTNSAPAALEFTP